MGNGNQGNPSSSSPQARPSWVGNVAHQGTGCQPRDL